MKVTINFKESSNPDISRLENFNFSEGSSSLIPIGRKGLYINKQNIGSFTKKYQTGGRLDLSQYFVDFAGTPTKYSQGNVDFSAWEKDIIKPSLNTQSPSNTEEELTGLAKLGVYKNNVLSNTDGSLLTSTPLSSGLESAITRHLNIPYVYGGNSSRGLDCSSFVRNVFNAAGHKLSGTADDMFRASTKIDKKDLKPGDLVFLQDTNPSARAHGQASHVGIVTDVSGLTNGKIKVAEASSKQGKTVIQDWDLNNGFRNQHWLGAGRVASSKLGGVLQLLKHYE